MKRILWILPVILLLTLAFPAAAQEATPSAAAAALLDWIPADFSAFVRVDTTDAQQTLRNLNLGLFIASVLQPPRVHVTQAQTFDAFFPLSTFDMENATFTQNVLPWLNNEVIIAYHTLGEQFNTDPDNAVMIFPTKDAFQSAGFLTQVIKAQDNLRRETYRDVIVYIGDKTAFAFTPSAVLVGPDDLLHDMIDTMTGNGQSLTADPVYQQVRAALPDSSLILGYLGKDAASRALSVLLSGGNTADPILSAINQSLAGLNAAKTPERLLLSGALDGVGVSVDYDALHSNNAQAKVVLHTVDAPEAAASTFDPAVLDLIPRSAMIVQSGTDAGSAATDALYSLPFLGFADKALAAFAVQVPAGASLPMPTARDAAAAVSGFLGAIKPVVDVQSDLLDKLKGSYSLALLPRPNDPLPGVDAPFDLLLVAQTDSVESAQAVQASMSKLLETFTSPLEDVQLDSQTFQTLRAADTGDPLISVGTVDNMVVLGTGSAAQLALDAQGGDNRLIKQDRWKNLSQNDTIPYVYVDLTAVYNTFLPQIGGTAVSPISQLGIQSSYLGDNLFALDVQVAVTQ